MKQVERLIAKIGSQAELARLCGTDPSRVTHWKKGRGFVPARYHQRLLNNAQAKGYPLTLNDFFDPPPKRRRRARAETVAA